VSEKPAEDKLAQDIDRAIEELEAAARALDAPEVRRTLRALSDAAKAVATIQDAVKAVALQDAEKGVIFQDRLSAPSVQDALKAIAVQDAAKAVAIQDAVKAVASSTSSAALRELVADEVKRARTKREGRATGGRSAQGQQVTGSPGLALRAGEGESRPDVVLVRPRDLGAVPLGAPVQDPLGVGYLAAYLRTCEQRVTRSAC
jgi:hypothetical protein